MKRGRIRLTQFSNDLPPDKWPNWDCTVEGDRIVERTEVPGNPAVGVPGVGNTLQDVFRWVAVDPGGELIPTGTTKAPDYKGLVWNEVRGLDLVGYEMVSDQVYSFEEE